MEAICYSQNYFYYQRLLGIYEEFAYELLKSTESKNGFNDSFLFKAFSSLNNRNVEMYVLNKATMVIRTSEYYKRF